MSACRRLRKGIAALSVYFCFAVVVLYFIVLSKGGNTPRGALGLPFVGYMPYLEANPYVTLTNLTSLYDSTYSVRLGSQYMIIVNDATSIRKVFSQEAFKGRPPEIPFNFNVDDAETVSFINTTTEEWRTDCLNISQDNATGETALEERIKQEIEALLSDMDQSDAHSLPFTTLLTSSLSDGKIKMLFGNGTKLEKAKTMLQLAHDTRQRTTWWLFYPWVAKMLHFFRAGAAEGIPNFVDGVKNFTWQEILEHEKTLDPDNIRDIIDCRLLEFEKREKKLLGKTTLLRETLRLFFDEDDVHVRTILEWLFLVMSTYPEVQHKVQEEIDAVVGKENFPRWTHHDRMPYTRAVIAEVMRWKYVPALKVLRYTATETEMDNYYIPVQTHVLPNFWSVHHDPEYWGDEAHIFKPERFLSEDGKQFKHSEYFMPYSIDRSDYLWDDVMQAEIFLYFTAVLQKFTMTLPDGVAADLQERGLLLQPKEQELVFEHRK